MAQAPGTCESALVEAEAQYIEGRFDAVITTLSECIQRDDVVVSEAAAAYRLISLAFMRKGDVAEARLAIVQLLNEMPEYEPDPIRDIPSYVAMVNLVKRELQVSATEAQLAGEPAPSPEQEEKRRSWFGSNKGWLLAGGSAALTGIVVILTTSAGGDGSGGNGDITTLPSPPTLPD